MKASISAAQAIAFEAESHELGRLLDDVADLLWRAHGEESLIGRLADEARWAAFMLHDQIARHAVREARAHRHQLAMQSLAPIDWVWRSPNRFQADPATATPRELTRALATCKAVVAGMSVGYARASGRAHPLTDALRQAEQAIDALHTELAGAAPATGLARPRTMEPATWRRRGAAPAPTRRAEGKLLLLRGGRMDGSPSEAEAGKPKAAPRLSVVARAGRGA